jgi:hypothetical protein
MVGESVRRMSWDREEMVASLCTCMQHQLCGMMSRRHGKVNVVVLIFQRHSPGHAAKVVVVVGHNEQQA